MNNPNTFHRDNLTPEDIIFIEQKGFKIGSTEIKAALTGNYHLAHVLSTQLPSKTEFAPTDDMKVGSAIHAMAAGQPAEYETESYKRAVGGRPALAKGQKRPDDMPMLWREVMQKRATDSMIYLRDSGLLPSDYQYHAENDYFAPPCKANPHFWWYLRAKPDYFNIETGELIDLKTSKIEIKPPIENFVLSGGHHLQLGLYALVLESNNHKVSSVSIIYTPSDINQNGYTQPTLKIPLNKDFIMLGKQEVVRAMAVIHKFFSNNLVLQPEDFTMPARLPERLVTKLIPA